jgi:hypothetical protein
MPSLLRQSMIPRTWPVSALTNVLIHGSTLPAAGRVVAEEPGPGEPVLIDAEVADPRAVDVGQLDHGGVDRVLNGPPRHPARRDLGHSTARVQHRIGEVLRQPGQASGTGRQLLGGLGERLPAARCFGTDHPALADDHLDRVAAGPGCRGPAV